MLEVKDQCCCCCWWWWWWWQVLQFQQLLRSGSQALWRFFVLIEHINYTLFSFGGEGKEEGLVVCNGDGIESCLKSNFFKVFFENDFGINFFFLNSKNQSEN